MDQEIINPLRGIIVPLVTPLLSGKQLDLKGLNNLAEHVIDGGVSAVFLLGTTGEAQHLSYELRREMIKKTCTIVGSKVPVLVGISDTSIEESVKLTSFAAACGAEAVVPTPPYYYTPGQDELVRYYTTLTENLELPLYLYNMPSNVKINIEHQTVLELAENPKIIGLKDSSANGVYFQKLLNSFKNKLFTLVVGPEEMTAETVLMGGHGGVNGGANIYPKLYTELYKAAANRDFETIQRLQPIVMEISTTYYTAGKNPSSYLRGLKAVLDMKGICSGVLADPYFEFGSIEKEVLAAGMKSIDKKLKEAGIL